MNRFPRGLAALGAVAAGLANVAWAGAQTPLPLAPCRDDADIRCGGLDVPLDRAQPQGQRLVLSVRVVPGTGPASGVVVLLAGGPGEAAITARGQFERIVTAAAPREDVVVFNQRGTGATALRCRALDAATGSADLTTAAARCAAQLGPVRNHYATLDTVADIEDLRVALQAPRITLVGVSYGTLVAQAYARTHPDRVARLVLDSVVDPTGTPWQATDSYTAARRVMAEMCARSRCAGVTPGLRRDVARLSARLARGPIPGVVVDAAGRPRRSALRDPGSLFTVFSVGDLLPAVRTAFPSAVAAALRGDATALLRLDASADQAGADDPRRFSTAVLATTLCGESAFPWSPDASPDQRADAVDAALQAAPPALFHPFARPAGSTTLASLCVGWPATTTAALPTAPLPDVPTLLLEGSQDTRTPVETAVRVRAQLPRARLVLLRGAGHSVIARGNRCVRGVLAAFFADRTGPSVCTTPLEAPRQIPVPPARLAAVAPQAGLAGLRGRTLRAARLTVADAGLGVMFGRATRRGTIAFRGLRSGTGEIDPQRGFRMRLARYEYVPGVYVSGTVEVLASPGRRAYDLRVAGPTAATGTIRVRGRVADGTLGGRPFRVLLPPVSG